MADLKISQLPAAGAITGAELVELVQSGANVQSTVTAIVAAAAPVATLAAVLSPQSAMRWNEVVINPDVTNIAGLTFGPILDTWTGGGGGASVNIGSNPSGASVYASVGLLEFVSTAAIHNSAEVFCGGLRQTVWRKVSAGALVGFHFVCYFGLDTARADQLFFIGVSDGNANSALSPNAIPSALLNCIGFGKDQGDANLQFLQNNGAGGATKTDTGLVFTSLAQKLMKFDLVCDPAGAVVTATLTSLEAGGFAQQQFSVLDAATKNIVTNAPCAFHFFAGTGTATATAVNVVLKYVLGVYGFLSQF